MKSATFTNKSERSLTLIIEPIAEEYEFGPGDKIEVGPPLNIDHREVIDIHIGIDTVIVFAPESASVFRNGKSIGPTSG